MNGSRTTPILVTVAVLAVLTASSARASTDWTTFGFDVQRTGDNPRESTLGTGNVRNLRARPEGLLSS